MSETPSVCNMDTLTFPPTVIPFPKIVTEGYLLQPVGYILAVLNKPNTQLPLLTYGETTTSAIKSTAKPLKCKIPCAPSLIPTPNPTPTSAPAPTPL